MSYGKKENSIKQKDEYWFFVIAWFEIPVILEAKREKKIRNTTKIFSCLFPNVTETEAMKHETFRYKLKKKSWFFLTSFFCSASKINDVRNYASDFCKYGHDCGCNSNTVTIVRQESMAEARHLILTLETNKHVM